MRLSTKGLKTVYLKKRIVRQDDEGNDIVSFCNNYQELQMNVQSGSGTMTSTAHGEKLPYTEKAKYQGDKIKKKRNEGDGVCVYVDKNDEPDYVIKSIHPKSFHVNITLEAIDGGN